MIQKIKRMQCNVIRIDRVKSDHSNLNIHKPQNPKSKKSEVHARRTVNQDEKSYISITDKYKALEKIAEGKSTNKSLSLIHI